MGRATMSGAVRYVCMSVQKMNFAMWISHDIKKACGIFLDQSYKPAHAKNAEQQ